MRTERFIVALSEKGRTRRKIWDASAPLALGTPFRWVIERTREGLRVRTLVNESHDKAQVQHVSLDDERNWSVPLRLDDNFSVSLKLVSRIPPAYVTAPAAVADGAKTVQQLFVYSGLRRWLMSSEPVHVAHVGYAKEVPVFTAHQNAAGLAIKPLMKGVQLRLKDLTVPPSSPDGSWQIETAQFGYATVTRGWYWWRFNLVQVPLSIPDEDLIPTKDEEAGGLLKTFLVSILGIVVLWVGGAAISRLFPNSTDKIPEKTTVVKIKHKALLPKGVAQATAGSGQPTGKMQVLKAPSLPDLPKPQAAPPVPVAQPKPVAPQPPKPSAAELAAASLRDTFKTAAALVRRDSAVPVLPSSKAAAPVSSGSINLSQTQVRSAYSGGDSTVAGVGSGGSGPGGFGGKPGTAGYGTSATGGLYVGKGGDYVSVDAGNSTVEEGLTKDEVGATIHRHLNEIRYCHESSMLRDPRSGGKLMLQFRINARGIVEMVKVDSSNLTETGLQDCVISRLKTWQFPKPKGGVKVTVTYPFIFKVLERSQ